MQICDVLVAVAVVVAKAPFSFVGRVRLHVEYLRSHRNKFESNLGNKGTQANIEREQVLN